MDLDELRAVRGLPLPDVAPDHRAALTAVMSAMPVSRHLGICVLGTADGVSVLTMPVSEAVTFDGRGVMGGIVGTLADMAAVSAIVAGLPDGASASTTGVDTQMIAPAAGDVLVAVGAIIHADGKRGAARADVYAVTGNDAVLAATCLASARTRVPG